MTGYLEQMIARQARLNRQWLPMPKGLALPKSTTARDLGLDGLTVLEGLAALVLSGEDAECAQYLRAIAGGDVELPLASREPVLVVTGVLNAAAGLTMPRHWPEREDVEPVQLGMVLARSALKAVKLCAEWWLGLPLACPDDAQMLAVARERAGAMQAGLHVLKVRSLLLAEAKQQAAEVDARRRTRKVDGSLDAQAVAVVEMFQDPDGPDYRPDWKHGDVADVLDVQHYRLSRRQRDGSPSCPEYNKLRAKLGRAPKSRKPKSPCDT